MSQDGERPTVRTVTTDPQPAHVNGASPGAPSASVPEPVLHPPPRSVAQPAPPRVDKRRFRRVQFFFLRVMAQTIWWDVILNRPGLRTFRTPLVPRWQRLAEEFRALALEMGGLLIKLAQFIGTRVDLFPPEVTETLSGLQDEVPPEETAAILAQLEADFGCPVGEVFAWVSPQACGSASLAQVHQARLRNGQPVVVKVLRPHIRDTVETDLRAFTQALRNLKWYKPISRYIDLDWLGQEFTTVTRQELDFQAEGGHAEQFATLFAGDPHVHVPAIYWEYTAANTLTMEDVAYIRISDLPALEAAGIDRRAVARKLYNLYLQQFLVTHFVHADPHAGNLFVRPIHTATPGSNGTGEQAKAGTEFQLIFVDFGMVVQVPERLRAALRDYAVGLGTRDAQKIVRAYIDGGMLVPTSDVDVHVMEEITQTILDRYDRVFMGQFKNIDFAEYNAQLFSGYRDFYNRMPFQMQADLLFVFRAMGILAGVTTLLDPDFDPFSTAIPFFEQLNGDGDMQGAEFWREQLLAKGRTLANLPDAMDAVLDLARHGKLSVVTLASSEDRRMQQGMRSALGRLFWGIAAVGLLLGAIVLHTGAQIAAALARSPTLDDPWSVWLLGGAVICFVIALAKR